MGNQDNPWDYRCDNCGGTSLLFNVQCLWDADEQRWDPDTETGDQPWCLDCEAEVNFDTIDLDEAEEEKPNEP